MAKVTNVGRRNAGESSEALAAPAPTPQRYCLGIVGDTGRDRYEFEESPFTFGEKSARVIATRPVAAGAAFVDIAMRALTNGRVDAQEQLNVREVDSASKLSTMDSWLVRLDRFNTITKRRRASECGPLRVAKVSRIEDPANRVHSKLTYRFAGLKSLDALLIHDRNGAWRDPSNDGETGPAGLIREFARRRDIHSAPVGTLAPIRFIVDLGDRLPRIQRTAEGATQFADPVWRAIAEHSSQTCVICSARMLRHEGVLLGRHISWERALEDLQTELKHASPLWQLGTFAHLIIRFGLNGAVYVRSPDCSCNSPSERTESGFNARTFVAVFGPLTTGLLYRDRAEDGDTVGENAMIAGEMFHRLAQSPAHSLDCRGVVDSIRVGLRGALNMFDEGYVPSKQIGEGARDDAIIASAFEAAGKQMRVMAEREHSGQIADVEDRHVLGAIQVDEAELSDGFPRQRDGIRERLEILRDSLNGEIGYPGFERQIASRVNLGLAITTFGTSRVLNQEPKYLSELSRTSKLRAYLTRADFRDFKEEEGSGPADHIPLAEGRIARSPYHFQSADVLVDRSKLVPLFVPILRLGRIEVVDRGELESIRAIRNQMLAYVERLRGEGLRHKRKPLSIAVFGQPGSGKSFAVKQIVKSVNEAVHRSGIALDIVECNVANFRALTDLENVWHQASSKNNEGRLPVVFFDEFDCAFDQARSLGWLRYFLGPMNDGVHYNSSGQIRFGPAVLVFAGGVFSQFASLEGLMRTSGLLTTAEFRSQKGPDFISRLHHHVDVASINGRIRGVTPIIRRAILLRGILADERLLEPADDWGVAGIDEDVLYAFLTVGEYKHEVRSLQNLVAMCRPINGRIEKASLPTEQQLSMHVNAEDFLARMYRSRWRREHALSAPPLREVEVPEGSPDTETPYADRELAALPRP